VRRTVVRKGNELIEAILSNQQLEEQIRLQLEERAGRVSFKVKASRLASLPARIKLPQPVPLHDYVDRYYQARHRASLDQSAHSHTAQAVTHYDYRMYS
jgi:hypothetical protein